MGTFRHLYSPVINPLPFRGSDNAVPLPLSLTSPPPSLRLPPNSLSPPPPPRNLRPPALRVSSLPRLRRQGPACCPVASGAVDRRFGCGLRVGEGVRASQDAMAAADTADTDPAAATSTCAHCQREIPSSNIDLHSAHCARNLQRCEQCGEMVARKLMDEHYNENHAPIKCSLCKETLEREIWDIHNSKQCPQRIVACEYCEFELPAVDLHEHQDVCGNRTEFCQTCKKYIRLREWIGHGMQCHVNSNSSAESSSARTIPEREMRPPPPARPAHGAQHKRLLFTIAVTGIAVMIGSILFQREDM